MCKQTWAMQLIMAILITAKTVRKDHSLYQCVCWTCFFLWPCPQCVQKRVCWNYFALPLKVFSVSVCLPFVDSLFLAFVGLVFSLQQCVQCIGWTFLLSLLRQCVLCAHRICFPLTVCKVCFLDIRFLGQQSRCNPLWLTGLKTQTN